MAYGLKISKSGHDAKSASNKNLIITSEQENLKVFQTGKATVTMPAHGAGTFEETTAINHNLGYCPIFILLAKIADSPEEYGQVPYNIWGGDTSTHWFAYSTSSQLVLVVRIITTSGFSAHNVIFKYFIFANKIT